MPRISDLPDADAITGTEELPVVQSGETKRANVNELLGGSGGGPSVTSGAGAPTSTPAAVGDIYIDTTGDISWSATGTASSADWKQATGAGGGDLLAANNLSDVADAGTSRTNLGVAIGSDVQAHDAILDATTASFTTADETKLDGIDAGATDDQTGAEIKAAYEAEADTNAFTDAAVSKLAGIEASADVTDAVNVAAAGAPLISTGSGNPTSTPAAIGDIYVDTTSDHVWSAAGTLSSADWKQATGEGGGDMLASYNLSDLDDAGISRTNLGVAIGSDVQAHDAVLDATTASFTTADETKLDSIEAGADVTDTANVAAAGAPIISTGSGNPTSTPTSVGDIYVDTTADVAFSATGTASPADWQQATGEAGDLLAVNNLSDVADAGTSRTNLGLEIGVDVQAYDAILDATTASFTTADETKLDGIETAATADQTGAEIKAAYEAEADTNAYDDAAVSKLAGIETGANVTDAANVAAAGAPIITSGAGAPTSTPAAIGDIYVDTTGDNVWSAAGTASSADWKQATGAGGSGPTVTSGAVEPSTTPTALGDIYVDTNYDVAWFATGTASRNDWHRATDHVDIINPRNYGAYPGASAADNVTGLNAAFDAAATSDRGRIIVQLEAGPYTVDNTVGITVTADTAVKVHIKGQGRRATSITDGGSQSFNLMEFSTTAGNLRDIVVDDLELNGGSNSLLIDSCSYNLFRNVTFTNSSQFGVYAENSRNITFENAWFVHLEGNATLSTGGSAIKYEGILIGEDAGGVMTQSGSRTQINGGSIFQSANRTDWASMTTVFGGKATFVVRNGGSLDVHGAELSVGESGSVWLIQLEDPQKVLFEGCAIKVGSSFAAYRNWDIDESFLIVDGGQVIFTSGTPQTFVERESGNEMTNSRFTTSIFHQSATSVTIDDALLDPTNGNATDLHIRKGAF